MRIELKIRIWGERQRDVSFSLVTYWWVVQRFKKHCGWGKIIVELNFKLASNPTFEDNQTRIEMSQYEAHSKTKHIDLKNHFVRHTSQIMLSRCTFEPQEWMPTKPRRQALFERFRRRLVISKDQCEEECRRVWVIGMTRLRGAEEYVLCSGNCVLLVCIWATKGQNTTSNKHWVFYQNSKFHKQNTHIPCRKTWNLLVVRRNRLFLNFLFICHDISAPSFSSTKLYRRDSNAIQWSRKKEKSVFCLHLFLGEKNTFAFVLTQQYPHIWLGGRKLACRVFCLKQLCGVHRSWFGCAVWVFDRNNAAIDEKEVY